MSTTRHAQLERILLTIYKDTAWMKDVLRKAYDSKFVDDSFVTDCAAVCDRLLEEVARQVVDYNVINKEVETISLKRRTMVKLDEARTRFKFLQRVIDL